MSKIDFTGRVAIITGAGAGLGRVHAIEFAKRGAKVVVNDLGGSRDGAGASASPADKVVEEIKALGGEAVANYDNVATMEGGENITKTAVDAYGKVDILVNNAGILRDKTFLKTEESDWDAVCQVHLKGAYCVTRPAFKVMKENGYGRIILTTSGAGIFGNFGQSNYSAAKSGVVGLANVLKLEGAKNNIKTNVLAPVAATRLTEDILPPPVFEKMKPEYVTPVVLYLCSEQCEDSGTIINAGLGYFSKSAMMTNNGVILPVADGAPQPEEIMSKWDEITNMESTKFYKEVNAMLGEFQSILG
ncbi:MAG TPA: serine/threonine protein kinase [Desulfobacteraceae bacterium]|nr:serine/threonine protein kinase [Desulfobacteraceae bacterium]